MRMNESLWQLHLCFRGLHVGRSTLLLSSAAGLLFILLLAQTQHYYTQILMSHRSCCHGKNYIGQSGRAIATRHKEHIRYIKTNNPVSAYATHILNSRHEYGTANDTLKLIQPCRKSMKMNHWENMYIQIYRQQDQLITEQQINELNSLYELAQLPHTLRNSSQADHQQTRTPNTHR